MMLDHFGLLVDQREGTADERLWIAGFLAAARGMAKGDHRPTPLAGNWSDASIIVHYGH